LDRSAVPSNNEHFGVEAIMRVLIADESVARSKAVRALFPKIPAKGPAAGEVVVSCATGKARKDDCSCAGVDLGDQPEHAAAVLDALGISLMNRGCLEEGAELIEKALRIRRKAFGDDHPSTAASLNSFSRVLRERGDFGEAADAANDALRINRAVFGERGLPVAVSLYEVGVVQIQQGRFAEAQKSASEGLAILRALGLESTDPYTTRLLDIRARAEAGMGKFTEASATYDALLKLDLAQLGTKQHPKYATHLANHGLVKVRLGNEREAERHFRDAIKLYGDTLGRPCHPNLIDAMANLGSLLRRPKTTPARLAEAGNIFQSVLKLSTKVRGAAHVLVGNDYANYGRWQYDTGSGREAKKTFAAALGIYRKNVSGGRLDPDHSFIAEAQTWLGRVLVEEDTAAAAKQAQPILAEAIAKWPVQRGPGTAGEAVAKACLGRSLWLIDNGSTDACRLVCEGYRILRSASADPAFMRRVEAWIKQQGCDCDGMPLAAV
jgi:tetratricopeptide (TPR) repeat protein